jgi:serine/threonine-protein kinase
MHQPLRLTLLGGIDLRHADGREARPVLQQPKRLALLAYLALNPKRLFHRRDSLLALFWPDLDQSHARAALRRATYFLRRALGDHLLLSRGDEELGLPQGLLWCDAVAFEAAIDAGNQRAALALYAGHLLEGFYVAGAPQIEGWLDNERARLRERAAQAAWTLTLAGETGSESRRDWALRAVRLAPDDEAPVRQAIALLNHAGDAAGAAQVYAELVRQLRDRFETQPTAETTALIAQIRGQPETAPSDIPSSNLLIVCPFSLRSQERYGYLAHGLVDLLSTALDGLGELHTVAPEAVLAFWRRFDRAESADATAQAVRHFGAGLVLTGRVVESNGRLRISIALHDRDGHGVAATTRDGAETDLFGLVDSLVREVLASRASEPALRLGRLAARTTESLPALKAYLQGEESFRLGRALMAVEMYQRAASLDSSFALAHYRLAGALAASALIAPARAASHLAMQHRARLGDHDQLLVEAQDAWLKGAVTEAERRYGAAAAGRPDDVEAWYLLGDLLFHGNPYRGRSMREARAALERTLALDHQHVGALGKLARIEALEGNLPAFDRLVSALVSMSPANDQALALHALRAFALGRREEQAALIERLRTAPALAVAVAFADIALYSETLDHAEVVGRAFVAIARSPELQAVCHVMLAHLAFARGRLEEGFSALETAEALDHPFALMNRALIVSLPFLPISQEDLAQTERALDEWNPLASSPAIGLPLALHNEVRPHLRVFLLGLLAARREDNRAIVDRAEQLAELDVPDGEAVFVEQLARTLLSASYALRGESLAALRELESARTELWFQSAVASPFYAGGYERFLRARLLIDVKRDSDALGWLQSLVERSPWELIFKAPAAVLIEKLHLRNGRAQEAVVAAATADQLWDPAVSTLRLLMGKSQGMVV